MSDGAEQGADDGAAVLPIREGIEPTLDVQREALDWFKDMLVTHAGPDLIGVCFTMHSVGGRCKAFSMAFPANLPNVLIEAQAAAVLSGVARERSQGQ